MIKNTYIVLIEGGDPFVAVGRDNVVVGIHDLFSDYACLEYTAADLSEFKVIDDDGTVLAEIKVIKSEVYQ